MKKQIFFAICLLLVISSCKNKSQEMKDIYDNIPSLEKVSGIWVSADTAAMEPSIRNFRGVALTNRDLTSVSWFNSPKAKQHIIEGILVKMLTRGSNNFFLRLFIDTGCISYAQLTQLIRQNPVVLVFLDCPLETPV